MIVANRAKSRHIRTLSGVSVPATPHIQAVVSLPAGAAGVRKTLDYMDVFSSSYAKNPTVRKVALSLVRDLPQKDIDNEIKRLFDYVKYRVRYVHDIYGAETLQTPLKTLELEQGDCDDKATLLASLLQALGFQTVFKAIGTRGNRLSHVYVMVFNKNSKKWIPLDTTENQEMGWEPGNITVAEFSSVSGLDGIGSSLKKAVKKVSSSHKKAAKKVSDGRSKVHEASKESVKKSAALGKNIAKSAEQKTRKSTKALAKGDVKGSLSAQFKGNKAIVRDAYKVGRVGLSTTNVARKAVHNAVTPSAVLSIEKKAIAEASKILNSKQFAIITTILSFFPLTAPFAWAIQVANIARLVDMAESQRKLISTMTAQQKKAFNAVIEPIFFVYDPDQRALRKKRPGTIDDSLPVYRYNVGLDKFELVSNEVSATQLLKSASESGFAPVDDSDVELSKEELPDAFVDDGTSESGLTFGGVLKGAAIAAGLISFLV